MNGPRRLLTALLVATFAAVAVISYSGLLHFAELAELPMPWLWPVVLDLAAAGTAVAAWYAQGLGHRARAARAFTLALVAVSAAMQMATAKTGADMAPWLVAAGIAGHGAAPAVLFGLLEVVLWTRRLEPLSPPAVVPTAAPTGADDGPAEVPTATPLADPADTPPADQSEPRRDTPPRTRPAAPSARSRRGTTGRPAGPAATADNRTDEQVIAQARALADELGMAPADLTENRLRTRLNIGADRAKRVRTALARPPLHAVDAEAAR